MYIIHVNYSWGAMCFDELSDIGLQHFIRYEKIAARIESSLLRKKQYMEPTSAPIADPMDIPKNGTQNNNPKNMPQKTLLNAPPTVRLLKGIEATTKIASGSADSPIAIPFLNARSELLQAFYL
jgi:hypothetical protein